MDLSGAQLAKMCGVSTKTIRHYLEKDLLGQVRQDNNGYRYYNNSHVALILTIKYYQTLNLPLSQIKQILAKQQSPGKLLSVAQQLKDKLVDLQETVSTQLQTLEQVLTQKETSYGSVHSALALEKYKDLFAQLRPHFNELSDYAWQQMVVFDSQMLWMQELLNYSDIKSESFNQVVQLTMSDPQLKTLVCQIAEQFFADSKKDPVWVMQQFEALEQRLGSLKKTNPVWQLMLAQTMLQLFKEQLTRDQIELLTYIIKVHQEKNND